MDEKVAPFGCFIGSLYPRWPKVRAGAGGDCLQASAAGGFGLPTSAKWTHCVSCWQSIPSGSVESGGRRQPQISPIRQNRSARSPPPAEGRNFASLNRPLRGLQADIAGAIAILSLPLPRCSLRPPVARASRPPPAGSDTRRCSCLRAGRLTRCRWALQPISLLGTISAGIGHW